MGKPYRVAAANFAPVFNDAAGTVDKACALIGEAASRGIQLLAFSELFISGFPHWCMLVAPGESDDLYRSLYLQAVAVEGVEIKRVREAARRHGVIVSIGFSEISPVNRGSIWNSNVLIDTDGSVLSHHRKLVPTLAEKLIFAPGDGFGLRVCETGVGRVGVLICGENTNPLARYTLIAQGEQVHISSYLSVVPAARHGDEAYDLAEAIRIRAACHSFEGKLFNVVASAPFDDSARDGLASLGRESLALLDSGARAVSLVVNPNGRVISNALGRDEEGFVVAEIDSSETLLPKRMHDVAGHYNRFDVFNLTVNMRRNDPIHIVGDQESIKGRRCFSETLDERQLEDEGE